LPYDWKTIFHDWLLKADVDYSQKTCVEAFDAVKRILGASWIDSFAKGARGLAIAIPFVELGKTLASIEAIPRARRNAMQRSGKDDSSKGSGRHEFRNTSSPPSHLGVCAPAGHH
jgi:hypothetical protein